MRKTTAAALALWVFFSTSALLHGGDFLDAMVKSVVSAPWKANSAKVKKVRNIDPLFENESLIIATSRIADRDATINYLFNKSGQLYNISWYAAIPTTNLEEAIAFEKMLVKALFARYGKPIHFFSDGDPDSMEKAAEEAAEMLKFATPASKEGWGGPPDGSRALALDKDGNFFMPAIFYSRFNMWNGGKFWIYTNLLCSTDGKCYLHLQFVSKKLTSKERYNAITTNPFAYTPMNRDQDLVTKYNDGQL